MKIVYASKKEESEYETEFRNMLDECYEPFRIGNLEYQPSRVLRAIDPIAFRCGLMEYIDQAECE